MKSLIAVTVLAMATGTVLAGPLYSNGPVIGAGNLSVLGPSAVTQGFGAQATSNNSVADDFTVGNGLVWTLSDIDFFVYQNNATSFTLQTVLWSIVEGNVNSGQVVASGTSALTSGGFLGYRVASNQPSSKIRPIYRANADIVDLTLDEGHYWLRWSMTGSLSSGPWQPPTADAIVGNATQSLAGGAFSTLADGGSRKGVELPFQLNGMAANAVPEPSGALLALGAGLAALLAVRRRRT